jgi:hypothetical protein
MGATAGLLTSEAVVVVIEAAGLRLMLEEDRVDALLRSTVANATSLAAGLAIYAVFF